MFFFVNFYSICRSKAPEVSASQQKSASVTGVENIATTFWITCPVNIMQYFFTESSTTVKPAPSPKAMQSPTATNNAQLGTTGMKPIPKQSVSPSSLVNVQNEAKSQKAPDVSRQAVPLQNAQQSGTAKVDDLMSFTESARSAAHQHVQQLVNACHLPQNTSQPFPQVGAVPQSQLLSLKKGPCVLELRSFH